MARTPEPAPPAEPAYVTLAFTRDPLGAARETLLLEAQNAAAAGAEGTPARAEARRAVALQLAARLAGDVDTQEAAGSAAVGRSMLVSTFRSANAGDVACKLALLVNELTPETTDGLDLCGQVRLLLAATALADVVLLGDCPIELPRDIGLPIEDATDVARLRARAAHLY